MGQQEARGKLATVEEDHLSEGMGCRPGKTIKNYRKDDPPEPAPKSRVGELPADAGRVAPGIAPRSRAQSADDLPNYFVTTPCQNGVEFDQPQLELLWSNYAREAGNISEKEMTVLIEHIFDAMMEQLPREVGLAMAENQPKSKERTEDINRMTQKLEQEIESTKKKELKGLVNVAMRGLDPNETGTIKKDLFFKNFNQVLKPHIDHQLDIIQARDDP